VAQFRFGQLAFGRLDWQRYQWWGRAAQHGWAVSDICDAAVKFLQSFEAGNLSRILFEVAPIVKDHLHAPKEQTLRLAVDAVKVEKLRQVVTLFDTRRELARQTIDCWSAVGRRLGVVKDIRVKVAQMVWEQWWVWGEAKEGGGEVQKGSRNE
jgi:hypothetical protein